MLKLQTDRPVAFFDIEATGINPKLDRIVDLAIVTISPQGKRADHAWRVHPERLIPTEAIAVHGITNEDVANCPPFRVVAPEVAKVLEGCDLGGYNILKFDIPMLCEEFIRAAVPFNMEGRRVIDAQRIFHRREPRDLSAALKFYCGELHLGAHGAMADVLATIRVLEGQFERYADLPASPSDLHEYCNPRDPTWADRDGRLKWSDGKVVINFGKQRGRTLEELVRLERGFLEWILRSEFADDTKDVVRNALAGRFPEPPAIAPGAE